MVGRWAWRGRGAYDTRAKATQALLQALRSRLITYCTAITSYYLVVGSSMRLALTEEAAEYCATGKLVRSAKDYARAIPEARKEELERGVCNPYQKGVSGVCQGLWREERLVQAQQGAAH